MTRSFRGDFGDFDGRIWLDTAHQGALPLVATRALNEAVGWKLSPRHLTMERFREVPERLRGVIGRLLNVAPADVVLSNSASYGIHLVAQAFPWRAGDEVLVVDGDFPSDILPWLGLEARGRVTVRRLITRGPVVEPDELAAALTPSTRLLCTTWVHSFSGSTTDLEAVGGLCRERDVVFLVNASQGLGTAPLDLARLPVDGVASIGSKWLCGPYGSGVLWLHPDLRRRLTRVKSYWLTMQSLDALADPNAKTTLQERDGADTFDIFGTANFFNFLPFAAAIEYLLGTGIDNVSRHNQALVSRLVERLPAGYRLLSPVAGPRRSTLVFLSHADPSRNGELQRVMAESGIDIALRKGALRISPHLYNATEDIDAVLDVLDRFH